MRHAYFVVAFGFFRGQVIFLSAVCAFEDFSASREKPTTKGAMSTNKNAFCSQHRSWTVTVTMTPAIALIAHKLSKRPPSLLALLYYF